MTVPSECRVPPACRQTCERLDLSPTRHLLVVRIAHQSVSLFEQCQPAAGGDSHQLRSRFRCSTSKFGIGQVAGSNCTPLGLHRIAEKIGAGCPIGTVFKSRQPVGLLASGASENAITTRILWLEGLEPGFNRGGDVDSHARYIYIHGTGDESLLGRPASHGCVHLAAEDLIPLFDLLPVGTLVWITED